MDKHSMDNLEDEKKLLQDLLEENLKILEAKEILEEDSFEAYALRLQHHLYPNHKEYYTSFLRGYEALINYLKQHSI